MGALLQLAESASWARDSAHTASPVASVWWKIFQDISVGSCALGTGGEDVQFRQNGCKLEFSIDCVHWQTLYDPSACIIEQTSQPPGGGAIPPGECRSYDVTLQGNGRWLLPVPVSEGYSITVTRLSGGWYDGAELAWRCPDGHGYVLGSCAGGTATETGDPINTAPHMVLIVQQDTGSTTFFEIIDTPLVIGTGVTDAQIAFLANDSVLTDNAGSAVFHVEVCNNNMPVGWEHIFNFAISNEGFIVVSGAQGTYVAATGWQTDQVSGTVEQFAIKKVLTGSAPITEVIMEIDASALGDTVNQMSYWTGSGFTTNFANDTVDSTGDNSYDLITTGTLVTELTLVLNCHNFGSHTPITLVTLTVRGTGTDPF